MKRAGGEKSEHYRRWQTIFNKSITVRLYEFVQHSRRTRAVRLFSVSNHSNKNSIVILVFAFFVSQPFSLQRLLREARCLPSATLYICSDWWLEARRFMFTASSTNVSFSWAQAEPLKPGNRSSWGTSFAPVSPSHEPGCLDVGWLAFVCWCVPLPTARHRNTAIRLITQKPSSAQWKLLYRPYENTFW